MNKKQYKDFFKKIKNLKKEQEKQKKRGLNNYNILTTVLKKDDEVRLHSRMIYSFLNPQGSHYQDTLFLDKFLKILDVDFKINTQECTVYKEYENIDLYITDGSKHIIIENKLYAPDRENQIERYIDIIINENEDLKYNDILVLYLSLDRKEPSSYSMGRLTIKNNLIENKNFEKIALFKSIHYKEEILTWLEKSQYEVQNIINLNEVFRQYIDVIKMLNNKYREKIMSLEDYILKNESAYIIAMKIQKTLPQIRKNVIDDFFYDIKNILMEKLGDEWEVELIEKSLPKELGTPLKIYKKSWENSKNNKFLFAFDFDSKDYHQSYFGIVHENKSEETTNKVIRQFKSELDLLNIRLETTSEWLHGEWLPNIDGMDDFVEYIISEKKAKRKIVKKILKIIKIFETNTNLLSSINDYLNKLEE